MSTKYKPHDGRFYSDISTGHEVDFAIIETDDKAVMVVKHDLEIAAIDAKNFFENIPTPILLSKKCESTEEAYQKMMKMIGKMVKKDSRGRYFTNTTHKDFETPEFFEDKALMKDLQRRMKPAKRLHII